MEPSQNIINEILREVSQKIPKIIKCSDIGKDAVYAKVTDEQLDDFHKNLLLSDD